MNVCIKYKLVCSSLFVSLYIRLVFYLDFPRQLFYIVFGIGFRVFHIDISIISYYILLFFNSDFFLKLFHIVFSVAGGL